MRKIITVLLLFGFVLMAYTPLASADNDTQLRVTQDFCEFWGDSIVEPFSCYSIENQGTLQHFISENVIVLHPAGAFLTSVGQEAYFDAISGVFLKPFKLIRTIEMKRQGNLYLKTLEAVEKTDDIELKRLLGSSLDAQIIESTELLKLIDDLDEKYQKFEKILDIAENLSEVRFEENHAKAEEVIHIMLNLAIQGSELEGKILTIPFEGTYFNPDKNKKISVDFLDSLIDDFNQELLNPNHPSKYGADFFYYLYKINLEVEDDFTYVEYVDYLNHLKKIEEAHLKIVEEGKKLLAKAHELNENPETHDDALKIYEFILANEEIFTEQILDEANAGKEPAEFFFDNARTFYDQAASIKYEPLKKWYLEEALKSINVSLNYLKSSEQYFLKGIILNLLEQFEEAIKAIDSSIELNLNETNFSFKIEVYLNMNKCSSASILTKEFNNKYPDLNDRYHELMGKISEKFNANTCVSEALKYAGSLYKLWDDNYTGDLRAIGTNNKLYFTLQDTLAVYDSKLKTQLQRVSFGLSDAYDGGHYVGTVALGHNGRVYVGLSSKIKSFDLDLNDEKSIPINGVASTIVSGENGKLYFSTNQGILYEMNNDFSNVKTYKFSKEWEVSSPTLGSDGTIYVSAGKYLHAITPDLSGEKWEAIDIGKINYYYTSGVSKPVIGKDNIIYVAGDNSLVALSPDGEVIGKHLVKGDWGISRPTIASDGTVYTTISPWSEENYIVAFSYDLKYIENRYKFERTEFWSRISEPVLDNNDNLVITSADDVLSNSNTLLYIDPREHSVMTYKTDSKVSLPNLFEQNGIFYAIKNTGFEALSPKTQNIDIVPPVIVGIENITINLNASFDAKQNVKATDDVDGDVSSSIIVEDSVNTSKIGIYTLTYKVTDKSGNEIIQTRTVTVVDRNAPIFEGIEDITINQFATFNEKENVTATDDVDGDVTDLIIIEGIVDTTIIGSYELTYSVVDLSGNKNVVKRMINVQGIVPDAPIVNEIFNNSLEVTGHAKVGELVIVKVGTTELGRGVVGEDENFSVPIATQKAGTLLNVIVIDNNGNESIPVDVTVGSIEELPGEEQPIDECFIATAAFGSKFTPAVELLRDFRDEFLLTNKIGQNFVNFYYKNSPPIAEFIANNEVLKFLVRTLLSPFVAVVYMLFHPLLLTLLVGLIGFLIYRKFNSKKVNFQ